MVSCQHSARGGKTRTSGIVAEFVRILPSATGPIASEQNSDEFCHGVHADSFYFAKSFQLLISSPSPFSFWRFTPDDQIAGELAS